MTTLDKSNPETAAPETATLATPPAGRPWGLWLRQVQAIFRMEARKSFFGRRAVLLYLAALLPLGIVAVFDIGMIFFEDGPDQPIAWATQEFYTGLYQGLILRMVVFFGSVWVFMNLFRGEVMDKSLHYYFLTPVNRGVLVVGKFLSGLAAAVVLFGGATALSYLLLYVPFGGEAVRTHLLGGPGLGQIAAYLGLTFLGCVGYGALFLLLGLIFKNPIIPAVVIFIWEGIHFLLPGFLKKLTVIHYLKPLSPVPFKEGPFALPSDPPSAWVSIGGLLVFAAAAVILAVWKARRMEVEYGDD